MCDIQERALHEQTAAAHDGAVLQLSCIKQDPQHGAADCVKCKWCIVAVPFAANVQ